MKLRAMMMGLIAAMGITPEQKTEAEKTVNTFPDVEIGEANPPANQTGGDDVLKKENETLRAMVAKQGEDLAAITKRFADQDAANVAKAKADREKEIAVIVEAAKEDGRIPAQNTAEAERWTKLLQADMDTTKAQLDAVPKPGNSANNQQRNGKPKDGDHKQKREGMLASVTNAKIADYVADIPIVAQ